MLFPSAWEGERDAPPETEQYRCHGEESRYYLVFGNESVNKPSNSHGFGLARTVSCNLDWQALSHIQRLIVTLRVPTFPLASNDRREIVCSPAASTAKSSE